MESERFDLIRHTHRPLYGVTGVGHDIDKLLLQSKIESESNYFWGQSKSSMLNQRENCSKNTSEFLRDSPQYCLLQFIGYTLNLIRWF